MSNRATEKKRTVLVIEDDLINREILSAILSDNYNVIEAENGQIGLDILQKQKADISLILLDIQMPVMNGYEFLEKVKDDPDLTRIPIIVTTSSATADDEIQCLENGATDFVAKPYNPDVVLRRVGSMIRFRELASVINKVEHDPLTSFYSRDFFFIEAEKELLGKEQNEYDIFCCEIMSLRTLQERYGSDSSNQMIQGLSVTMKNLLPRGTIFGRLSGRVLAALVPHLSPEQYEKAAEGIRESIQLSPVPDTTVHLGVNKCVNHSVPVAVLCDNTRSAIEDTVYQYGRQIAEYSEAFRDKRIRRQTILGFMETALKENQFTVFYQPKHKTADETVGGAEALVRWNHPQLGFISPGEFIPLFESNGFITQLDFYVADRVCSDIRKWIDEGKKAVPVSWNLSRADFSHPDLVNVITNIADKYSIPRQLLHIEVTESAYATNSAVFMSTVNELHKAGFCIELDDFGSGYSSLTSLGELQIDVLKLDMYFAKNMNNPKQQLILEHIFSIAHTLDVETVAEGIETAEQAERYKDYGCTLIQGYYYSKPLPIDEFENYVNE